MSGSAVNRTRTRLARIVQQRSFTTSADYWRRRYERGGTSGSGSYGEVGRIKADVVNTFIREHDIQRVIDLGCGDGNQLSMLHVPEYIGVDVSPVAIDLCLQQFADDPTKSFALYDPARFHMPCLTADLVLSMDVILHLVEDDTLARYLRLVDTAGTAWAIFYTEDQKQPPGDPHVRYRNVADWLQMLPGWELVDKADGPHINGHPSDADFFILARS